jgi:hypothetical protein
LAARALVSVTEPSHAKKNAIGIEKIAGCS